MRAGTLADRLLEQALSLHRNGEFLNAERIYKRILQQQPDNAEILHFLGIIHYQLKQPDSALRYTQEALKIKPDLVEAYYNLGNIRVEQEKFDEAIYCYEKAMKACADFPGIYNNLCIACRHRGLLDKALQHARKAIALDPNFAEAYNNLGLVMLDKGEPDDAIRIFRKALEILPDFADALHNLANALAEKEQFDEAIIYFQRALKLRPVFADAHNNLGNVFVALVQLDKAISCFENAIKIEPQSSDAHNNMGFALQSKGIIDEAISFYKRAISIKQDHADAHHNLSLALLSLGNFYEGWEEYEWRWSVKNCNVPAFLYPPWDGSSLRGKTILVYTEQGIGDEIMFASCLPDLIKEASTCVVECDRRLVPLFKRSFPEALIVERIMADDELRPDLPPIDFKVAAGSLPGFFRKHLLSFPIKRAYLLADPEKIHRWQERFSDLGDCLKIGISWRGGKQPYAHRSRSIDIMKWSKLFNIPGLLFVNLQYGDCSAELQELKERTGIEVHDWADADPLKDLDTFAAEIAALDLVISADNATVHMAGALGKPVWTLLPFSPDWRWMKDIEDSPWYSSMRLFRQNSLGDWESVFSRVCANILDYIQTGSSKSSGTNCS